MNLNLKVLNFFYFFLWNQGASRPLEPLGRGKPHRPKVCRSYPTELPSLSLQPTQREGRPSGAFRCSRTLVDQPPLCKHRLDRPTLHSLLWSLARSLRLFNSFSVCYSVSLLCPRTTKQFFDGTPTRGVPSELLGF